MEKVNEKLAQSVKSNNATVKKNQGETGQSNEKSAQTTKKNQETEQSNEKSAQTVKYNNAIA